MILYKMIWTNGLEIIMWEVNVKAINARDMYPNYLIFIINYNAPNQKIAE